MIGPLINDDPAPKCSDVVFYSGSAHPVTVFECTP